MQNRRTPARHLRRTLAKGATLIEILVALLILSLGLLGMAGLQARAVKGNHSAMQRTQAVMMSYYILDTMRVDRANAKAGNYNRGKSCSAASFSGTNLPDRNLKHWIESLQTNLGTLGDTTICGELSCDADGLCLVKVSWDDSRAGGLGVQTLETRTKL
jgi:type IV pilus assembly protein PilV